MTVIIEHEGIRHDICLPPTWDKAVSDLIPLMKANGGLANTPDTRGQLREAVVMALEYGCEAAADDLRGSYLNGVARVMGEAA